MSAAASDIAVAYVLRRMREDGRVAYLLGPGTETWRLLTEAWSESQGVDLEQFRREYSEQLRPERMRVVE